MKSRLPPQARLTKKQQRIAWECAERHLEAQTEGIARRYCKLLALALREPLSPRGHGMGAAQILKVLERVDAMAREYARNPFGQSRDIKPPTPAFNQFDLPFCRRRPPPSPDRRQIPQLPAVGVIFLQFHVCLIQGLLHSAPASIRHIDHP